MDLGLIGGRLGHSHSPWLHAQLGSGDYRLVELTPEELPGFFARREFRGLNVTAPYKRAVLPYLDELDPLAAGIGAVNTVVRRGGRLVGYNTDCDGLAGLLRHAGIDLSGKKVLILGTGGASRTALAVCGQLGAARALQVSRSPSGGAISYEAARTQHRDAGVILNATPVGMLPDTAAAPLELSPFSGLCGVLDLIYNPLRTPLVQQAQTLGIPASGGLYMLVRQAVRASELFRGAPFAEDPTDALYRALLRRVQNVVLIGMPTCGKSTVGRLLAEKTGLPLVDTDARIEAQTGSSVSALFAARGETAFRDLETAALRACCQRGGQILAVGGGAILREENLRLLRQNGRLFFLDRPLFELQAAADRPLSGDRIRLRRLYTDRRAKYLRAADETLRIEGGSAEDYATAICGLLRL